MTSPVPAPGHSFGAHGESGFATSGLSNASFSRDNVTFLNDAALPDDSAVRRLVGAAPDVIRDACLALASTPTPEAVQTLIQIAEGGGFIQPTYVRRHWYSLRSTCISAGGWAFSQVDSIVAIGALGRNQHPDAKAYLEWLIAQVSISVEAVSKTAYQGQESANWSEFSCTFSNCRGRLKEDLTYTISGDTFHGPDTGIDADAWRGTIASARSRAQQFPRVLEEHYREYALTYWAIIEALGLPVKAYPNPRK